MTASALEASIAWIALCILAPICLITLALVWRQHRLDKRRLESMSFTRPDDPARWTH